jgi:single-strand DNA-binding protein
VSNGTPLSPGNDSRKIVGEFVVTGAKVYIEGKLQTSSWEDRGTGQTKYRTEIVARDLVLLRSRGSGTGECRRVHPDSAARHETPSDNAEDPEDIPF